MAKSDSYKQKAWSLKDLYSAPDGLDFKKDFKDIETKTTAFEKYRSILKEDITEKDFMSVIKSLEEITRMASKMNSFAGLMFAANTQDQTAQTLMAKIQQQLSEISNRGLFFELWWKDLPEAAAERLMKNSGDYRYWLEEMRHFKKHTLSEPEEKIINTKNVTGVSALNTLYDSITNRYTFKIEVDGEMKELTRGELMVLVRGSDPDLRARAYQEMYRVYSYDAPILGQIYQTIARDWFNEEVQMRHHATPISARNLVNDLPDDVIELLLKTTKKNTVVFQRFFKLKANLIGMKKLRRYDLYAATTKVEKTYPFDEAAKKVFESFSEFDAHFAELADMVFKEDHLDSEIRKGKEVGAFCATVCPEITPWVKLNYQGKIDDVSTMAHELGHAIHSLLANKHTVFTQHACLPLAETASTFGEMMLVDKMLAEETDEAVKRDILFRQMDDSYATIMRQVFFAIFEKDAHKMIVENASVDEIAEMYLKNLKEQLGSAVDVSDEFKWEWVSVPHFYNVPFYVYAYAFGQLLVLALYKMYKNEGESFKPKYIALLSAGGSKPPMQVLQDAGVDVTKESFWQGGFDLLMETVEKLEKMA